MNPGSRKNILVVAAALFALSVIPSWAQDDVPDKLQVKKELAFQLYRAGEYSRAAKTFEEVLVEDPGDAEARRGVAGSYELLNRIPEAVEALEPVVKEGKAETQDYLTLGRLYVQTAKPDQAINMLNQVSADQSLNEDQLLELASLQLGVGRAKDALESLGRTSPEAQESQRGLEIKADALAASGSHLKAAQAYRELAGPDRSNLDFAWRYAEELALGGNIPGAYDEVKILLGRGSPSVDQLVFGTQVALDVRDVALAEATVNRIPGNIRTEPVLLVRAEVHIIKGEYREAAIILEEALGRYPGSLAVRRTYASVLYELVRYEEALAVFAPVLAQSSPTIDDLKLGGQIHRALGHEEEAYRIFRQLVRRRPADTFKAIEIADFLIDEEHPQLAIELLDGLRPGPPHRFPFNLAYGRALFGLHASDEAIMKWLLPLINSLPAPVQYTALLADFLLDMGKEDAAVRAMATVPDDKLTPEARLIKARILYNALGDRQAALLTLQPLLGTLSDNIEFQFAIAEFLHLIHMPEEALEVLKYQPAPQVREFAYALLEARILYLSLGQVDEARVLIDGLIHNPYGRPAQKIDLASLILEVQEIDKARTLLDTMKVYEPPHKFRHAMFRAFVALRSKEGPAEAKTVLEALEEWLGENPDYYLQLAEAYLELPDRVKALAILNRLKVPERHRFQYMVLKAQALIKINKLPEAGHIAEMLEPDLVGPPDKRASLVEVFLGLQEKETAEQFYKALPAWWLRTQEGMRLSVNMNIARKQGAPALDLSRTLVARRPADPNEKELMGQSFIALKAFPAALEVFEAIIDEVPHQEGYLLGRVQALRGLGRNVDAVSGHLALVDRYDSVGHPVPADFVVEAAEVLDETKQHELALQFYKRGTELRPTDPEIAKGAAGTLTRLDRPQEAIVLYKKAMSQRPTVDERVELAGLLEDVGGTEKALLEYQEVLKIEPDNVKALQGVAGILSSNDKTRRHSLEVYQRILEIQPGNDDMRAAYASNLARLNEYVSADAQLEVIHEDRPRQREARRVRADMDVVHGYLNMANHGLTELKYEDRTDPQPELGMADVANRRGKEYLHDEVHHVLQAKKVAPHRESVTTRMEQLFLPLAAVEYFQQTASDTLDRFYTTATLQRLLDDKWEGALDLSNKRIARRDVEVTGNDLIFQGLVNPARGFASVFKVTTGELGADFDFLPGLELRWKDYRGLFVRLGYERLRVDDSPDALVLGLRSNTFRGVVGRDFREAYLDIEWRQDEISDGNSRRNLIGTGRWNPWPNFQLSTQLQVRDSNFTPFPFDLYFAPEKYFLGELGTQYRFAPRGPFEIIARASVFADALGDQDGTGVRGGLSVTRKLGPLAGFSADLELLSATSTRRQNLAEGLDQTTFNLGYSTRF